MEIKENYIERLIPNTFNALNKIDISNLYNYFKKNFSIDNELFFNSTKFYKELKNQLLGNLNCSSDLHVIEYIHFIGISKVDLNEIVYIIWETPNQITKLKLIELCKQWEDIWIPPADDALILYFPNKNKIFLITDFGVLFFNN